MERLTSNTVKKAKQEDKSYKMTDGRGLYLLVKPEGKYWRYNFRFLGKQKTLALGVYPDVSLTDARRAHQRARAQLREGIDPVQARREKKLKLILAAAQNRFRLQYHFRTTSVIPSPWPGSSVRAC